MIIPEYNSWADFWRYEIGANIIPMDSRNKMPTVTWKEWQEKPIPEELHNQWKNANLFNKGMAVICGKLWHKPENIEKYLVAIDCDNKKAIQMVLNGKTIDDLATKTIVEQHLDNRDRMHAYFIADKAIRNKYSGANVTGDKVKTDEIPIFEVKSTGNSLICCTCSIHSNGHPYQILGIKIPLFVKADQLESDISSWCNQFGISYLDMDSREKPLLSIEELFNAGTKILEGQNRHEGILRVMESLLQRNKLVVPLETIKKWAFDENQRLCVPPLNDQELEKQWKDATEFIEKKNQENNTQSKTQKNAELLAEQIDSTIPQLFKDQYGTTYSEVRIDDHNEIISLESSRFKRFLSKLYYDNNDHKIASTETINNVVQILQAKAEYENPTIPLFLRVAWSKTKDAIYYDLTDEKWRAVKITKESWITMNDPPIMFKRYNQKPQVMPNEIYDSNIFDKFIDLTNVAGYENKLLLKVYIISLFVPDIPHVILTLIGEKGSAKTLLLKMIKLLVDPSKPELLTIHNDMNEFIQQIAHNYVPLYDNVKNIPKWLSDEACKAVTGIGLTKRKLYTDDEDIVYEFKHCLGFNGINMSLTEPDARDRSILIQLDRIGKENRKLESEKGRELFNQNIKDYFIFENLRDDTSSAVKTKVERFETIQTKGTIYYELKFLLDSKLSESFGIKVPALGDYRAKIGENSIDFYSYDVGPKIKDLSNTHRFFHWELEFPDIFFDENGDRKNFPGFDIILGNPPYLNIKGVRANDVQLPNYFKEKYESATERYDLYVLFVEMAAHLLRNEGTLSYILPHKFTNSNFGKGIRLFLTRNKLLNTIISFGHNPVFEDSTTYTGILTLNNTQNANLKYAEIDSVTLSSLEEEMRNLNDDTFQVINNNTLNEKPWILKSGINFRILDKIRKSGQDIMSYFDIILNGLQTEANEIYILTPKADYGKTMTLYSDKIQLDVQIEKEMLKSLLKGEDIKRFAIYQRIPHYVIYPYVVDKEGQRRIEERELRKYYPLTFKYLSQFKKELIKLRTDFKTNPEYWHVLHRGRRIEWFHQTKIMTPEITFGCNMTLDENKFFHNETAYSFLKKNSTTQDIKFFLAILNSKLLWFFVKNTGNILRGGFFRFKTQYLEPFCIPSPTLEVETKFVNLIDEIFRIKKLLLKKSFDSEAQKKIIKIESEINQLVYQLYGLTEEEIKVVESNYPN